MMKYFFSQIVYDLKQNYLISECINTQEAIIYDFRLGVQYVFERLKNAQKCQIQTLRDDHLTAFARLFTNEEDQLLQFNYLGQVSSVRE